MNQEHLYNEVADILYPIHQSGKTYGLGRFGELDSLLPLLEFSEQVKVAFEIDHIRFAGDSNKPIQKVAILGGSGEKYISQALKQGADVYITGDTTFHPVQEALDSGLAVIDAGHYIEKIMKENHYIEKIMKENIKDILTNEFPDMNIVVSSVNTNPYQFV